MEKGGEPGRCSAEGRGTGRKPAGYKEVNEPAKEGTWRGGTVAAGVWPAPDSRRSYAAMHNATQHGTDPHKTAQRMATLGPL